MSRTQVFTNPANKVVASNAVPEQLQASSQFVKSFIIEALPGNTDFIFIGDSTRQTMAIAPGKAITVHGDNMDNGTYAKIDLSSIYVKVNVNGEGVAYLILVGL